MSKPTPVSRSLFPPRVVSALHRSLTGPSTFLEKDSFIVFVCGANPRDGSLTARDTILAHARRHWSDLHFFRAEDALRALREEDPVDDLLTYESDLARYADCILIIIESEGVIAELGAFAQDQRLVRILLAVNDSEFRHEPSFIREGPLKKISRKSRFGSTIHANLEGCLTVAPIIEQRLRAVTPKRGHRLNFLEDDFKLLLTGGKERLLLLLDLVALMFPIKYKELIQLLVKLFGDRPYNIRNDLTMLEALRLIERKNDFYVRGLSHRGLFLRFGKKSSYLELRALVVAHYHKYSPSRVSLIPGAVLSCYD